MNTINPEELKQFVENNPKLVTRRESKRYPGLFTLKYTRAVFYDALWDANPLLLECRGLVVDADYNVVVKPFTKVFNYQENGTTIPRDELCTAVVKVNGFMACVTKSLKHSPDKLIVSTTGSLDSEHVDIAYKYVLHTWWDYIGDGQTLIFEICDPSDPHIVSEKEGAWLIGGTFESVWRGKSNWSETSLDGIAKMCNMLRPQTYFGVRFSDIVKMSEECEHEGFMVYSDTQSLKIKSPYYLITKFLARMKETRLRNIIEKGNIREAMRNFDEEYYPLITYLGENLDQFSSSEEQDRIKMIRDFLSRKE